MYLQFLGDIAAVGDDRISGDAQMVGNFLIGHALHKCHDDITLALAQRVVLTLVFHHAGNAVELHALLLLERGHEFVVVRSVSRQILDDDVFEFPEFRVELAVMFGISVDVIAV